MSKQRVMAFIDGYNLYHGVDALIKEGPERPRQHLKWVNLWELVKAFTAPSKEDLVKVYYFSAYATWLPEPYARHRSFVKALESVGVTVVLGKFNEKGAKCRKCGATWKAHEEKATDVNIALHLLDEAMSGSFDRALILTGDADIKPAVSLVKSKNPNITITALLPKNRFIAAHELKSVCHGASKFDEMHLSRNLFPEEITLSGGEILTRPDKYKP